MIAQLSRHHALFGMLPEEVQVKIAASTKDLKVHTQDEAERIEGFQVFNYEIEFNPFKLNTSKKASNDTALNAIR